MRWGVSAKVEWTQLERLVAKARGRSAEVVGDVEEENRKSSELAFVLRRRQDDRIHNFPTSALGNDKA
jgi:hypothetical protein